MKCGLFRRAGFRSLRGFLRGEGHLITELTESVEVVASDPLSVQGFEVALQPRLWLRPNLGSAYLSGRFA